LQKAKRTDLIGDGCDSLIPSKPPKEALESRRKRANDRFRGDFVHTIKSGENPTDGEQKKQSKKEQRPGSTPGYRPGRRQDRRKP
jgi:hypothetical protein